MIAVTRGQGSKPKMPSEFILALDQGTSSSRALVIDGAGQIAGSGSVQLKAAYPRPGWVEQDPEEIWAGQLRSARRALASAGINASDIRAIGVTNQRETTLMWNRRTGVPVAPAIVWQDRRTETLIESWRGKHQMVRDLTGLIPDAYFSASKIRWLLDSDAGLRQQAENGDLAFGTVDTWLLYRLTGGQVHATDVTNASRTMLFNTETLEWDDRLLAAFGIPAAVLPEVHTSTAEFGTTTELSAEIPILAMAGDQHAATFGQACFEPGLLKCTYGTGCFLMQNAGTTRPAAPDGLLSTIGWQLTPDSLPVYALEGSVFVAGSVVSWLRDSLGLIASSGEVEELARSVPDTGGVMFVPAFSGLGAPHWDPSARGAIVGLTFSSTKGHLARAALEGIAYQVADMAAQLPDMQEIRVDGGAAANNLLMQFQADLTGRPVVRSAITETTALGAAYMAGIASGLWSGLSEVAGLWREDARFEPSTSKAVRDDMLGRWHAAVERAKGWSGDQTDV